MRHPAILPAAVSLLLMITGSLALAQTTPAPDTAVSRLLQAKKSGDSYAVSHYLVQALADAAEFTRRGKSLGDAMRAAFGSAADNEWLHACVLANWRVLDDFSLITPENLVRMHSGKMPVIRLGSHAGAPMMVRSTPNTGPANITYRLQPIVPFGNKSNAELLQISDSNAESFATYGSPQEFHNYNRPNENRALTPPELAMPSGYTPAPGYVPLPPNVAQSWNTTPPSDDISVRLVPVDPPEIDRQYPYEYPRDRWTSGPAPKFQAPTGANVNPLQKPILFDVKIGEAVQMDYFAAKDQNRNSQHLILNNVDSSKGINFGVVDPSKTKGGMALNSNGGGGPLYSTNVVYYHVEWNEETIPGAYEKGVYLISINGLRLYLDSFQPAQNTFRVIACAYPLPEGAEKSLPQPTIVNKGRSK